MNQATVAMDRLMGGSSVAVPSSLFAASMLQLHAVQSKHHAWYEEGAESVLEAAGAAFSPLLWRDVVIAESGSPGCRQ